MAESGADQHECRITVRKTPHHAGTDASPMLEGKICIGQRLFDTVLNLLAASFSFIA